MEDSKSRTSGRTDPQLVSYSCLTPSQPVRFSQGGRIRGRKWGWTGYTPRKSVSSITRRAVTWNPQGKRQLLFVACLRSQRHASVSQGRICTDNFTCCHTEMEAADPTFHLTQSQYTDTGPTSPSADPIIPGAWQGSHWSANF